MKLLLPALIASLLSGQAVASVSDDLTKQRALYQKAHKMLQAGDTKGYKTIKEQIKEYPLYPYLEFEEVQDQLSKLNQSDIDKYYTHFSDSPLSTRLNRNWRNHLYRNKQWQPLIEQFEKKPDKLARYQCQYHFAKLKTGEKKDALAAAGNLWQSAKSQPKACDPLFAEWIADGRMTSDKVINRFWLSVRKRNHKLGRYLEKKLSRKDHKEAAALYFKAYSDPAKLNDTKFLQEDNLNHGIIFALSVRQYARSKRDDALALWLKDRDRLTVSDADKEWLDRYFGVRIGKNFFPTSGKTIATIDPDYQHNDVTEWRIRVALSEQDWKQAAEAIQQLSEEKQQENRWVYWHQIVSQHLDRDKKPTQNEAFVALAGKRDYYGFLAADLLGEQYQLNHQPGAFDKETLDTLRSSPAFARMKEFIALNQYRSARSEWNHNFARFTTEQRHAASHIVSEWGWHDQAIRGAAKLKKWDDLTIRFPKPHIELFRDWADKREIDQVWPVAIARQESAFNVTARSRVGARGLMQLMPKTARLTAKRFEVPYKKIDELYQPSTNISLGTAYLAQMLKEFDGNRIYATAAYNAGPHRVKAWLKSRGKLPIDIWVETIPFDETRKYVQNVLAFSVIYNDFIKRDVSMLSEKEQALLALNQFSESETADSL